MIVSGALPSLSSLFLPESRFCLQTTVATGRRCAVDRKGLGLPCRVVEVEPTGDECEEGESTADVCMKISDFDASHASVSRRWGWGKRTVWK